MAVGANCTHPTCQAPGAPNLTYTLFAFHQSAVIFQAGKVSRCLRAGEGWKAAGRCRALPQGAGHDAVALALEQGRECSPGHPEEEPEGKVPPQSEGWDLTQLPGSFPLWACTQRLSSSCMVRGPVDTVDWERHVHLYFRTVDRSGSRGDRPGLEG